MLEESEQKKTYYKNKYDEIFKIDQVKPDIKEITEVLTMMSPVIRESILEYLTYYSLTLAQEALKTRDIDKIAFRDWWFTVLATLKKVFEWLKLKLITKTPPETK